MADRNPETIAGQPQTGERRSKAIGPLPPIDEIRKIREEFTRKPKDRSPLPPMGRLTTETRIPLRTVQEQSHTEPIDPARVPHLEEIKNLIERGKTKK